MGIHITLQGVAFGVLDVMVPQEDGTQQPQKLLRLIDQQSNVTIDIPFGLEQWGRLTGGSSPAIAIARTLPPDPPNGGQPRR